MIVKSPVLGLMEVTAVSGKKYLLSTMTLFLIVYPRMWTLGLEILAFSNP